MHLTEPIPAATTMSQWAAAVFRSIATRLDGFTIEPPAAKQVARERLADARFALREAEIALLDAQAETERCDHTVQMLNERVSRLSSLCVR